MVSSHGNSKVLNLFFSRCIFRIVHQWTRSVMGLPLNTFTSFQMIINVNFLNTYDECRSVIEQTSCHGPSSCFPAILTTCGNALVKAISIEIRGA